MIKMLVILMIIVVVALVITGMAMICLHTIVKAKKHTESELRAQETRHGFADAIADYDNRWKRNSFKVDTGEIKLYGEYIINNEDNKRPGKVVVIAHGHTVSRICSLKYAKLYYDAGFSIVIYDERYFGKSEGKFCTLGQKECRDIQAITAYTRTVFGDDCVIGLHGESMGAATVLASLDYEKPAFVVADCPFASTVKLYEHVLKDNYHLPKKPILPLTIIMAKKKYGYMIDKFNPIDAVSKTDVPICFMHGLEDKLIPCSHSIAMFNVCRNENSEIHLYEGTDHAMSMSKDKVRYNKEVLDFVDKVLK